MFYLRARDIAWFKKTLSLASLTNAVEDTVFFVAKSGEGFHADVVDLYGRGVVKVLLSFKRFADWNNGTKPWGYLNRRLLSVWKEEKEPI